MIVTLTSSGGAAGGGAGVGGGGGLLMEASLFVLRRKLKPLDTLPPSSTPEADAGRVALLVDDALARSRDATPSCCLRLPVDEPSLPIEVTLMQ